MRRYKPIVSLLIVLFVIHTTVFAETFVNIMDFNKWRIDAVESYSESSLALKEYGKINCSNEVFEQLAGKEKMLLYIENNAVAQIKTKGFIANVSPMSKSFVLSVKAPDQSQIVAVVSDDKGTREKCLLIKSNEGLYSNKIEVNGNAKKVRMLEWENLSSIKPINDVAEYVFSEDDIKTMNGEIKDNSALAIVTGTVIKTNDEGGRVVTVEFIKNGENGCIELPADGNEVIFDRGSIFDYGDIFILKDENTDIDKKDVVISKEDLIPTF